MLKDKQYTEKSEYRRKTSLISNYFKCEWIKLSPTTQTEELNQKEKKNDSTICCLKETDFAAKDTKEVKVIGKKKIFHVNCQKRPDVATLTLDITNFNLRTVIQYYKGHIYW